MKEERKFIAVSEENHASLTRELQKMIVECGGKKRTYNDVISMLLESYK